MSRAVICSMAKVSKSNWERLIQKKILIEGLEDEKFDSDSGKMPLMFPT